MEGNEARIRGEDSIIHKAKTALYKNLTLEEGVQSIIGITILIVAVSIICDVAGITGCGSIMISTLNSIALVLWTASCSFLLFSIERMEVRSLGIRLRDILEDMVSRRTIIEAMVIIFAEMVLLVVTVWSDWGLTSLVLTLMQIANAGTVFYVVLRYSSRDRALIAIKHDAYGNMSKIDKELEQKEILLWQGRRLYPLFRLLVLLGIAAFRCFNACINFVIYWFAERTRSPLKKNGLTGFQYDEWLIIKMCRSIDYKSADDCTALEAMLKETLCKDDFKGQRGMLLKCVRLILNESDNLYHSVMLISNLYNADVGPCCQMNIRKAILEALLERGTNDSIKLVLRLGEIERKIGREYEEEELRCWKYVCVRNFKRQLQLEEYVSSDIFNDQESFAQDMLLTAIRDLAEDQEMGYVETLQRICM